MSPKKVTDIREKRSRQISYKKHGHWVRHRKYGHVGRIGYYLPQQKLVAVVWEPATKTESNRPTKEVSASLVKPSMLRLLPGYEPDPWYDFKEIERREKSVKRG